MSMFFVTSNDLFISPEFRDITHHCMINMVPHMVSEPWLYVWWFNYRGIATVLTVVPWYSHCCINDNEPCLHVVDPW